MVTRILGTDLTIADVEVQASVSEDLVRVAEKIGMAPGRKVKLTEDQLSQFTGAVNGHPVRVSAGGSSFNTLLTLAKLRGGRARGIRAVAPQ